MSFFFILNTRCVLAVRSEWKSVGDSLLFWCTDYNDDTATKLALVQQVAEMPAKLCTNCKTPQE